MFILFLYCEILTVFVNSIKLFIQQVLVVGRGWGDGQDQHRVYADLWEEGVRESNQRRHFRHAIVTAMLVSGHRGNIQVEVLLLPFIFM